MTRQFYYRKALYNDWLSGVDKAALKALPQRDTETSNMYDVDAAIEQGIYSKAEIQAMRDFNEFARKAEHIDAAYDSIVQSATEAHKSKTKAETKPKTEAAKETKNGVDYLVENVKLKTEAKTEAKAKSEVKSKAEAKAEVKETKTPEKPFTDEKKDAKIEPEAKYEPREPKVGRLTKEVKEGRAGGDYARTEKDLWLEGAKRVDIIDELSLEMAHEKDPEKAKELEKELLYWLKEYCGENDYERLTNKWKGQMSNFEEWKAFQAPWSKFGLASDENLYSGIRRKIEEQKGKTNERKGKLENQETTGRSNENSTEQEDTTHSRGDRENGEGNGSSVAGPRPGVLASSRTLNQKRYELELKRGEVRYPELADVPSTKLNFGKYGEQEAISEDFWPQDFKELADEVMHQFDDFPRKYKPRILLVKGFGGEHWEAFYQCWSSPSNHFGLSVIVIPADAASSLRQLIMHESGHALDQGVPYMPSAVGDIFLSVFGTEHFKYVIMQYAVLWQLSYGPFYKTSNFIKYVLA